MDFVSDPTGPRTILDRAPDFSLPSTGGELVALQGLLRDGPVMLAFYRGHWCPYCCRYLAKLQSNIARFVAVGAQPIAISPESPATAVALKNRLGLTFHVLSDIRGTVIDHYGVRSARVSSRSLLPHPAVFVIDPMGMIRFRSIDRNYKKRTTMRTIFSEITNVVAAGDR